MKYFITICFLIFFNPIICFGNDYNETYEQERKLAIEKARIDNYQISDADLISFLEDMFKYLPEELENIKSSDEL